MWKLIRFILFASVLSIYFYSCSSNKTVIKSKNVNYSPDNAEPGIGGRFAPAKTPAKTNMRILVVFAQFKDDNKDPSDKTWPVNKLPVWANDDFIGTDPGDAPFKPYSLSNYFYEMSYGQNIVTGYIYPDLVILDLPPNTDYSKANSKLLEIIDEKIDFKEFDKWDTRNANKQFYNKPDNYVDAVYLIYRNLPAETWGGIAMLGTTYKTKEGPIVASRIPTISMTLNIGKKGDYSFQNKIILLAHEYAHYLLGENHDFEPEFSAKGENERGIGLMPGSYGTSAMNPEEKYLLGYIRFVDVFKNMDDSLPDFQQTGKAFRIPIPLMKNGRPNTDPDEFFIVANHQKLSIYEKTKGKGVYIYHVKSKYYSTNQMDVVCADGLWQWKALKWLKRPEGIGGPVDWVNQNGRGAPFSEKMPVIVHDHVDRINGRDELHEVLLSKNEGKGDKSYWWDRWIDENGKVIENPIGDPGDAFNMGYNELFSPWSNPASYSKNHKPTYVTVQLLGNNNGVFKVRFYTDSLSSLEAPPAKPQNLNYNLVKNKLTLTWEPNIEPDMKNGGYYKIYRASVSGSADTSHAFFAVGKAESSPVKEPFMSWNDPDFRHGQHIFYKISAVDNTGKESVKSEAVEIILK